MTEWQDVGTCSGQRAIGPPIRDWRITFVVSLFAFIAYRATSQSVLHFLDSGFVLHQANTLDARHPWHLLVLYPFVLVRRCLDPFGVSNWDACKTTVALGGAVCVGAAYRTALAAGLARRPSLAVAALVACTPAVAYFATIVELQAIVMATAGISVWAFAELGRRPSILRACGLGATSAIAATFHSSNHVLAAAWWALSVTCLWPMLPTRRIVALLTSATTTHLIAFAALYAWLSPSTDVVGKAASMLGQAPEADRFAMLFAHRCLWEYVIPFAPASVLLVAFLLRARERSVTGMLLAVLLGLVVTMLLLPDPRIEERGAYLLFLAIPLAVFMVVRTPARTWPWLAIVGCLATWMLRADQATHSPCSPEVAQGARMLEAQSPRLFVSGSYLVLDSIAAYAPELRCLTAADLHWKNAPNPEQAATFLANAFDALVLGISPSTVVIDETTFTGWVNSPWPELRHLAITHIPDRYRVTPVEAVGFRGLSVTPR